MKIPFSVPENKIFLCGMPGSGKSTLGKKLANYLQRPFFDLDKIIAQQAQKTITEIFETSGEEAFRIIESSALKNYAFPDNAVVALGGGTPCFHQNIIWLKENGTLIYVKQPLHIIEARLKQSKTPRPLLKDIDNIPNFLSQLLLKREVYYLQADIIWEVNEKVG